MKKLVMLVFVLFLIGCKKEENAVKFFKKYDETVELKSQQNHQNPRMRFKLLQSKFRDMNEVFKPFQKDLSQFTDQHYTALKPLVLEQSIPSIQQSIKEGKLNYEQLTLFYLFRIRKFESDSTKYLNAIVTLNPNVLKEAKKMDKLTSKSKVTNHSIYGMPILLKDNINAKWMNTTAGAEVLSKNNPDDAFITRKLKENGALILGKVNLSEWAYYFCSGCPLGYSAIGGQTLNPYGRKKFETGGSSSGSGVATAANYAIATIGTETAGSITSPSSQNSVVGLKPTIGLLSRSGIVPISSTLDTPGPMTKNVIDNYILLRALLGKDKKDNKSFTLSDYEMQLQVSDLNQKNIGVLSSLLNDSIYKSAAEKIKRAGANIVEISPKQTSLQGFLTLLNIDMKHDLTSYLKNMSSSVSTIQNIIDYNAKDSLLRAPYGQKLFEGIVNDTTTLAQLKVVKQKLKKEGRAYFKAFEDKKLDAILSINNYHSAYSAVAEYPNLTVPMGYKSSGEPISLTFIGKPKSEFKLLELGLAFERLTNYRKLPLGYD